MRRRTTAAAALIAAAVAALSGVLVPAPARALVWPDVPEQIERRLASQDPVARRVAAQEIATLSPQRGAPLVMQALGDPDVEVKRAAAQSAIRLRVAKATDVVLGWLGDRDTQLRIAACDVARALPDARSVPQLARALGDADAGVRAAAADALGAQASAEAVAPLLGKLDDASPPVRIMIARSLARLGDKRAVVPLVGKVQDSVPDVRQAVARALGDLGDGRAAQALLLQLRDNVPEVRVESLQALGRLRAPEAVDAIGALATDRSPALRRAALSALGRIGTREAVRAIIGTLGFGEDAGGGMDRTPARDALVEAGPVAVNELSAVLQGNPGSAVASSAAWVLGELHAQAAAPVVVAAMRKGVLPTPAALHALAGAGRHEDVPVVLEFVGDSSRAVRAEAARAAAALLDPSQPDGRAVEPLAAALRSNALDAQERAALAGLLGRTGAPRAAPVLVGLVSAKDPALRLAAIDALGTLGAPGADDELTEKLSDPDAAVRLHAAVALGEAGGARARDALLAKMDGGDELDRAAVLSALGGVLSRVPNDAAVAHVAKSLDLVAGPERDALLEAGGRARTAAGLSVLETGARSSDPDDRRTAATLLPVHGRAGEPLARSLLRDPDAGVRAQAAWALGTIGDAADVPDLERVAGAGDIDAGVDATAALARIAVRARSVDLATRALCPRLGDRRAYVRANALVGLAALGASCADGARELALLGDDPSELVRGAAALVVARRASGSGPGASSARAALDRCAQLDRSGAVALRCRQGANVPSPAAAATPTHAPAAAAAPAAPSAAAPRTTHAVEIYVVPESSSTPRPRAAYAVELADGFLRGGTADRRGACFEPFAPDGDVSLRRPSAQVK